MIFAIAEKHIKRLTDDLEVMLRNYYLIFYLDFVWIRCSHQSTLLLNYQVPVAAVVVMACNRADYLKRTIESILKYDHSINFVSLHRQLILLLLLLFLLLSFILNSLTQLFYWLIRFSANPLNILFLTDIKVWLLQSFHFSYLRYLLSKFVCM